MGTRPRPGLKVAQRAALGSVEDSESIGDGARPHQNSVGLTAVPAPAASRRQHMLTRRLESAYADGMSRSPTDLAEDLDSTNPEVGLRAVAALRRLLENLEALHVRNARAKGWSWQDIADSLGVTKQTVHRKHARR